MLATRVLLIVISSSIATASEDSSKDVCRPCSEVKCPPLPENCSSEAKFDKCGCCMICVMEHRTVVPTQVQSSVEDDTKLKSLKSSTDDDSDPHRFMFKSSRDGFPPIMRETIRIRIFPLGGDGEIAPENQMRSILSNVPSVPLIRNILEMLGNRNSPIAETLRGFHEHEEMTPSPDKIVEGHEKLDFKSLSDEEANKMKNSSESNGTKSKPDSIEGQDKSFKITRISIVPIVYKFSRPNVTDYQERSLPGNSNSTRNISEDSVTPNTVIIRRIHLGDPFEGNMPFAMDPRFNIINSVMRLMMSHFMESQARQLSHDIEFDKDRQYSDKKETVKDDVSRTSRIIARHSNIVSHPSFKLSLGSKSTAEQHPNGELQMSNHDLPGTNMKQLEENLIDSMEGKSNSGDMSFTIVKTSSRNKRDAEQESAEQDFRLFDLPFPINGDIINPLRLLGNIVNEQAIDPRNNLRNDISNKGLLNLANTNKVSDHINLLDFIPNVGDFENPFESMPLNLLDKMFNRIKSEQSGGKNTIPAFNLLNMFLKDLRKNKAILDKLPKPSNARESIMGTINMKSDRDVYNSGGSEETGNKDAGQPFLFDLFENRNLGNTKEQNFRASETTNSDGLLDKLSLKRIKSALGQGQNAKDFQTMGALKNLDLKRMLDKSYFLKKNIPKDVLRRVMDKFLQEFDTYDKQGH